MASSRFVLLIVGMLVDFFDRDLGLSSQRQDLVGNINALARAFRESGESVIWIRQEFASDLSDAFLEMRRTGTSITIAGTQGCNLLPKLVRHEADLVIVKKRYSGFFQTGLDEVLTSLRATTLVVAGINTHACVRSTVIDAYQRDYDVILASQCIGSHDAEHHDVTVRYLDGKMVRLLSNAEMARLVNANAV